jgi:hypothetical protein
MKRFDIYCTYRVAANDREEALDLFDRGLADFHEIDSVIEIIEPEAA